MENSDKKQKKKKSRKPLYILIAFFIVFGFFIYLISQPSPEDIAKKELITAYNKDAVREVWENHKSELYNNENFLFEIRAKLSSLPLSEAEIKDCISWLPPAPVSLNIIVIPDLSNRIDKPGQIDSDKKVLEAIWNSFESHCKLKKNSNDRLIIDVTDKNQAAGEFEKFANNLRFDLSQHKGKSNRLYFTKDLSTQYMNDINAMYASAMGKSMGADYYAYFKNKLVDKLKVPDLFWNYRNKVIIITDGYIDLDIRTTLTETNKELRRAVNSNENILEIISNNNLNIPSAGVNLSDTDILVCEVNERKSGENKDFQILKVYWEDWLKRMDAHDKKVIQRNLSSNETSEIIKKFITP